MARSFRNGQSAIRHRPGRLQTRRRLERVFADAALNVAATLAPLEQLPSDTDVLVVPHHGSRTSSTPPFIQAVAPRIAVFSCGYQNRFGHPRPDIVSRYAAASVGMIRTDVAGAVTLTFAPDKPLVPISARDQRRRYWMDVPEIILATEEGPPVTQ